MKKLHAPHLLRSECYIDGSWQQSDSGSTIAVTNPSTQSLIGHVPSMEKAEANRAIEAAYRALPSWRDTPAQDRATILRRWFNLIIGHQDDLASIMTAEQGKPLAESKTEITYAASFIEWFAEQAKRTYGDTIPSKSKGSRLITIKQPVGVCAAITPWNFPAAMITRKAGAALAAGCTMVVKPASQTPLSALALAVLAEEAGVPDGVLSVITGDSSEIGKAFTSSQLVRKLTFTGSTKTGAALMRDCANTIKKVSLELGGNAPFIVFDDADLEAAAEGVIQSKFRNTGQTCVCANRIFIHDTIYEKFTHLLAAKIAELKVGDGFEPDITQGPLINIEAVEKVESLLADATSKGATIAVGGRRHAKGGTFFEPTLLTEATSDMQLAQDEIFGPVAPLFRFQNEAEVIAMANDTEYGLAAYFYSRDIGRIWRTAEALECGMVGINTGIISTETAPFGGIKQSGIGREGSHEGIEEYLESKYLNLSGL
ncbi:NAD-dependent succinate-semialdehyde dehydrogenase [Phragmitibacter flavus]|uniref:NAD-dependent succinate-semialdehyde dehydrogenase n=1 Tax=Phragmitibacter flavus TaxID=2576071 RepID=A0A5R8KH24_9BACT|nr:NAD-dependent succinate-semialdehyde dehydrogenase [Phragmitibacter flavus]TLD71557.1 NAD-dependent succinate-semialdehyde dehydrogenase [Phragmitibacter flavus]